MLIQLYARPDDAVLDLACGKVIVLLLCSCQWLCFLRLIAMYCFNICQGGDLIKWDKARIGYYVGIDIAEGSVCDRCILSFYFLRFLYLSIYMCV